MKRGIERIVGALALVVVIGGCGPKHRTARPLPGTTENVERHALPGTGVELLEEPGLPSLHLVQRGGDPAGAVAVAVFPPAGTAGSTQIAALVSTRLEADSVPHQLETHGFGFVLVSDVTRPRDAKDWFDKVYAALHDEVTESDVLRMRELPLLAAAEARGDSLSPYGLCMGELGAEGKTALTEAVENTRSKRYASFLDELRRETAVAARVGLAALGDEDILDAAQGSHQRKWAQGDPLDDSWTKEPEHAVVHSRGARELRVALRANDSNRILAAARALRDPSHPLHGRLHALDPRLVADNVRVTLRPAGSCLGLTIAFDSSSQLPLERVAAVGLLAKEELAATVNQVLSGDEEASAILSPQGARESAALAAWTAVRSHRTGGGAKEILEFRGGEGAGITHQALSRALEETSQAWSKRSLPFDQKDEPGQAELWAVLASPCGTSPEPAEEAGLRALTVSALARDFDRREGVRLDPWVSPGAVGIIAHGPRLRGESVARHATRVARALGNAFYGDALTGRTVAAVRAGQLDRLGDDPGIELVTTILGAGMPSLANPWGTSKTVATFSVADAERNRADLAQEPLRLAVLTNGGSAQGPAARGALESWLAPARAHVTACPKVDEDAIPPGTWQLETIDEHVTPGAFVAVFAPARAPVGQATAYLLNRRGGYLDRAFSSPALVARAEAQFLGGPQFGGLFLRVTAEPGQLDAATAQARAVLASLADPGIPAADAAEAISEHQAREDLVQRSQLGRLIRLYETSRTEGSADPEQLTESALRSFHKRLGGNEHRVVTVRRRK